MYTVSFKPRFIRQAKKLEKDVFVELLRKIDLLKDRENHQFLRVHKLHGRLSDCWAFSVDNRIRVVFEYETKNDIILLDIDDHDVYKKLKR